MRVCVRVVALFAGLAERAAVVDAVPEGLDGRDAAAEDEREGLERCPQESAEVVPGRVLSRRELGEVVGFYYGAGGGAGEMGVRMGL